MSFKLPKELEPLGFTPLDSIDKLEKNDLIVIPSLKDERRLRVSLATLRKWGLSVTSDDYIHHYGCDCYSAARQIFGEYNVWRGSKATDDDSHVLVVETASHDKNASYGKNSEVSRTFENANSISDNRVIVEKPVFPIMSVIAFPMNPLYPLYPTESSASDEYPSSFSRSSDKDAYRMLMDAIGTKSIPTSATTGRLVEDGYEELPFFLAVLSCICNGQDDSYQDLLGGGRLNDLYQYYGYNHGNIGASHLIMTAPTINDKGMDDHCGNYFHSEDTHVSKQSLHMNKQFLENIFKRGALLYRSPAMNALKSQIQAHAVAVNMGNRYTRAIHKVEKLVNGLKNELPKILAIRDKYKEAAKTLAVPDDMIKSIKKTF